MEVVVIGMGYVGIPTAALLADVPGFNVLGVQRRSRRSGWKIDHLNAGKSPIEGDEPGLGELIQRVVGKGSFRVTDDTSVCADADAILIAVQTPVDANHVPQYTSLEEVSRTVGQHMKRGVMIIIESTVAPGTTQHFVKPILEEISGLKAGEDFNLVFSYERVMVGRLLHNLRNMPKVVGGLTLECTERAVSFYRNFVKAEILPTDCLTAEVSKVTENAYRDVNIAFANEVALICESLGVNVYDVRSLVNSLPHDPSDPGKNPYRMMHIPGAGVGGHCLPKDTWLLKYAVDAYGRKKVVTNVLEGSRFANDYMPMHMKELIEDALNERNMRLDDARVCILGFAFLEDSDDTRNTPSLTLYNILKPLCREVRVNDPYVDAYENVELTSDLKEAVKGSDCLAVVTRHREYLDLRLDWLKNLLATPVIVDGRNIFNPEEAVSSGFTFRGVGIGTATGQSKKERSTLSKEA